MGRLTTKKLHCIKKQISDLLGWNVAVDQFLAEEIHITLTDDIKFSDLEKLSKLFKTKNINVGSEGYCYSEYTYGSTNTITIRDWSFS